MKYNTASQEFHVIAFDASGRVSGDASNITCELAIDGGSRAALSETNPTEIGTTGEYVFTLTQAETAGHQLSFTPVSAASGVNVLGSPSNVIYTTLEAEIKARTDLVVSGSVSSSLPVSSSGQIGSPLLIGDDYLASLSRAFEWTIDDPGMTDATSTCKLGFYLNNSVNFEVSGSIVDNGSTWTLSFDISAAITSTIIEGYYKWSVHVADASSKKITTIKSAKPVFWTTSQTTVV